MHTESSLGWGGQELRILTESVALKKLGVDVHIVCDKDSLLAQRGKAFEVPLHAIRLKKKRWADLRSLDRALTQLSPNVVSSHSSTDHWLTSLSRKLFSRKFKIVRTRHVSAAIHPSWPTRWLYRHGCEFIMTTGESIRRAMLDLKLVDPEKIAAIPTGIDLTFFSPPGSSAARKALGIPDSSFVFCNVGTLRSWKGQHDLLEAFASIRNEDSLLLIVGDGPQAESLKQLSASLGLTRQVRFAGHQSDVRPYLEAANTFVFPSYANEGIPQAILQAIAYRLPIITTTAGSIEEAVQGYPCATVLAPRDVAQLAQAMRNHMQAINKGPAQMDWSAIRERISIDTMAARALDIYTATLTHD